MPSLKVYTEKNHDINNNVRMAERSKAPDSRYTLLADSKHVREFWSSYEGVGSNPTSDNKYFLADFEHWKVLFSPF